MRVTCGKGPPLASADAYGVNGLRKSNKLHWTKYRKTRNAAIEQMFSWCYVSSTA